MKALLYPVSALLALGGLFTFMSGAQGFGEAVETYYVTPTPPPNPDCPSDGPACETLQHLFTHELWGALNCTLIFLNGEHTVDLGGYEHGQGQSTFMLNMIGLSPAVSISNLELRLVIMWPISKLYFTNITLNRSYIEMYPRQVGLLSKLSWNMLKVVMLKSDVHIHRTYFAPDANYEVHIKDSSVDCAMYLNHTSSNDVFITLEQCDFQNSSNPGSLLTMKNIKKVIVNDCHFHNNEGTSLTVYNSTVHFEGTNEMAHNLNSALVLFDSNITLSGKASFINNTGIRGGAIALYYSTINIVNSVSLKFTNNTAEQSGGALHIEPDLMADFSSSASCFCKTLDSKVCDVYFANNSAVIGGNDIYGASLESCLQESKHCNFTVSSSKSELSSVSGHPNSVCSCSGNGKPDCSDKILTREVYPGETFAIPTFIVGGDNGTTIGTVYAGFIPYKASHNPVLSPYTQYSQTIGSNVQCTMLNYTLKSNSIHNNILFLTTKYVDSKLVKVMLELCNHTDPCNIHFNAMLVNISLLPCPPGFTLNGSPPSCDCYPVLTNYGLECHITDGNTYFTWNTKLWINIGENGAAVYNTKCTYDYCNISRPVALRLPQDHNVQCAFNRGGRLCGSCQKNYSLAIGSSHCIPCTNNNKLALLVFFAAAGFLLVLFIFSLNLTVTQGMINGLIFYANIIWAYEDILFQPNTSNVLILLKSFIAWLNLDFGIQTCFSKGLDAFWMTWLQFVFPLYIWSISGLIIVATRHSIRLTNLFGNRAVPVLATLFLLSYTKILRTIMMALQFSILKTITTYTHEESTIVWSVDGNLKYFGFPHIILFLVAMSALLFLWLPYTLLLLLMQWLRKISHFKLLRWTMRFNPLYDAYFAPLKAKHQYWFGLLLLVRGIILVLLTSTFALPPTTNVIILQVIMIALLFYLIQNSPYKSRIILIVQSSFFMNLTLLSGFVLFAHIQGNVKGAIHTAVGISVGVVFLQFCTIILFSVFAMIFSHRNVNAVKHRNLEFPGVTQNSTQREKVNVGYRDSILEESEPLLRENIPTY